MYPFYPLPSQDMRKLRAFNSTCRASLSQASHRGALTTAPQGLFLNEMPGKLLYKVMASTGWLRTGEPAVVGARTLDGGVLKRQRLSTQCYSLDQVADHVL